MQDNLLWDKQIEADAAAGRFDPVIEEIERDIQAGRTKPLDGFFNATQSRLPQAPKGRNKLAQGEALGIG